MVEGDSLYERRDSYSDYAFPLNHIVEIRGSGDWRDFNSAIDTDALLRGAPVIFSYGNESLSTAQDELVNMGLTQASVWRPGLQPTHMFSGNRSGEFETDPEIHFES